MSFKDFTEFFKLPLNVFASLSIVTGGILFLPENIIKKLYMLDFRNKFGFVISIIFMISITLLLVLFISHMYKNFYNKRINKKLNKIRYNFLLNADKQKVKTIKEFIKDDTHTLTMVYHDGLTVELQYHDVIQLAGNNQLVQFSDFGDDMYVKFFLQPWVIKMIEESEELKQKYK